MKMTITEKILAKSAGKTFVEPGQNIWLNVDVLMTHDVCGPPTIEIWKREFGAAAKIWDKNKLVIFPIIISSPKTRRQTVTFHCFVNLQMNMELKIITMSAPTDTKASVTLH